MTEDEKIIWAAGFFDGEGCVSICRQSHSQTKRPQYQLQISVVQKDLRPVQQLYEMFGGEGWLYPYKVRGIEYWRWVLHGNQAMRALELLRPFMVLKADRASVGIEFQGKLVVWNRDYGRRGYPEEVNQAREEMFLRMKALNQRGISDVHPQPKRPGPHGPSAGSVLALARKNRKSDEKEIQTIN